MTSICATNHYPIPKRKAILTHVIAWSNLEDTEPTKTRQKKTKTDYLCKVCGAIKFIEGRLNTGCQGLEEGKWEPLLSRSK